MSLVEQVKQNLLFHNLWTQVTEIELSQDVLIRGKPKEKLLNDETNQDESTFEIVLPIRLSSELTMQRLHLIFKELEDLQQKRPKRILVGIVNDDSTVVYYFIHDGVYKPKKN